MPFMSVTLDVSKLSGWLNADANCRVERRAYDAERGVGRGREGVGRLQRTSGMHGEMAWLWEVGGARACAERTRNMAYMVVTLDVSQLETSSLKFCK
eukprot:scaffold32357_cov53-Phaeocystis_antarctica.AAC.2